MAFKLNRHGAIPEVNRSQVCVRLKMYGADVETWAAARPMVLFGWHRVRDAWLVLTGKADAVVWWTDQ